MRLIAHRGNIAGTSNKENNPEHLMQVLARGYDIEVDVHYLNSKYYLGHDKPEYEIDKCFLFNKKIWSHAKDVATYYELLKYKDVNTFFHQDDAVIMTSHGYIWSHPKNKIYNERTVVVEVGYNENLFKEQQDKIYAICSDQVESYKKLADKMGSNSVTSQLPFKLLIIDIDGVMTDGTKNYDLEAKISGKRYCDLDFTAIKRFKAAGIKVCFLSGDKNVNEKMAASRKIDFYFARTPSGNIDKSLFLPDLAAKYKIPVEEMAYIGDDYYDLSIIENLNYTFCPETAIQCIKDRVTNVLSCPGGHGVVAALYDLYKDTLDYAFPVDSLEENPK